tara:strand:+ start:201746 stop:202606 length:861 start_codon:yes stop_codon:yes gene_type:complete
MSQGMSQEERNRRRRQIAYEALQGMSSLEAIAKEHSVSVSNVRSACKQFGVDPKETKETLAGNVARAIEQGMARVDAMRKFGVTAKFIQSACSKHKVLIDPIGNNSERSFEILADLLNTPDPITIIANRHSVSSSTVSKLYNLAISKGFPIMRRRQGQSAAEPHRVTRIGICLDDAIDFEPDFFRNLTRRLAPYARIYIMAGPNCGLIREVVRELEAFGIVYHQVAVVHDRAEYVKRHKISVLIDDKDDVITDLGSDVLVMKPRTAGNYDFESQKWLYTEATGEQV